MPASDLGAPANPPTGSPPVAPRSQAVARRLLVPVVVLAVLAPYLITLLTLWARTGDELDRIERERAGLVAARPLLTLLAATADAQTSAVAGDPVDATPLRAAMAATDAADSEVGVRLNIDRRWADVRSRLAHLITTAPKGAEAYPAFSQVIDLELALLEAVGDGSELRIDSSIDSHYLMEAALLRVPEILVTAGRISDLTLLIEERRAPVKPDTLVVAVTESELRAAMRGLDDGLRKGFGGTRSRTLGPALLGELDRLRDAAALIAPPLSAVGGSPTTRKAAATESGRRQVRAAALETGAAAMIQLDDLLGSRAADVRATRRTVAAATAAGLLAVLAVVWFAAPRRRPRPDARPDVDVVSPDADADADADATTVGDGIVDLPVQDPSNLLEARDLLEARQLIRVGRAVAPRREDSGPPPEEGR